MKDKTIMILLFIIFMFAVVIAGVRGKDDERF